MLTELTSYSALAGGVLIGLAATLLHAKLGHITNTGAMLDHALEHRSGRRWRLVFLLSMVFAAGLWSLLGPGVAAPRSGFPIPWLIGAGLLVGYGSRLGSDRARGQRVFSPLSRRAFAPAVVFVACAAATVFLLRQVLGGLA